MKAGTIFTISADENEDYDTLATLRALRDLDLDLEIDARSSSMGFNDVIADLVAKQLAEHVYVPNVYIGAYGRYRQGAAKQALARTSDVRLRGWVPACFEHSDCAAHPGLGATCLERSGEGT